MARAKIVKNSKSKPGAKSPRKQKRNVAGLQPAAIVRRRNLFTPSLDPYMACWLSSTNSHASKFKGIPNLYSGATIKLEHVMSITILPDNNGNISFCILPSPLGGLAVRQGKFTANVWDSQVDQWQSHDFDSSNTNWTGRNPGYAHLVLPFTEWQKGVPRNTVDRGDSQVTASIGATQFTVAASKARIMYAGDTYHNQGVIHVGRMYVQDTGVTLEPSGSTPPGVQDPNFFMVDSYGALGEAAISVLPDYTCMRLDTFGGIELNNLPMEGADMVPIKAAYIPTIKKAMPVNVGDCPFSQLGWDGTGIAANPLPGLGRMTTTFVQCSGMDTTNPQPIRIYVKNCVEYAVQPSSTVARFATDSPKANMAVLKAVSDAGKNLPAAMNGHEADQCGWMCKAGIVAKDVLGGVAKMGIDALASGVTGALSSGMGALALL